MAQVTKESKKEKASANKPYRSLFEKELHPSLTSRLHYPEPEIKDDWAL